MVLSAVDQDFLEIVSFASLEVVSLFCLILLLRGGTEPLPLSMFPLPLPELLFCATRQLFRFFLLLMRETGLVL